MRSASSEDLKCVRQLIVVVPGWLSLHAMILERQNPRMSVLRGDARNVSLYDWNPLTKPGVDEDLAFQEFTNSDVITMSNTSLRSHEETHKYK